MVEKENKNLRNGMNELNNPKNFCIGQKCVEFSPDKFL